MQSQLSRHIRLKHGNKVAVADSLKLTRAQRMQQFKIFKRKGISDHNKIQAKKKTIISNVNARRGKTLN